MKVNRNDPCPCGSGKKYKKCCLLKENEPKKQHQFKKMDSSKVPNLFGSVAAMNQHLKENPPKPKEAKPEEKPERNQD